jgi:hypothetical protein
MHRLNASIRASLNNNNTTMTHNQNAISKNKIASTIPTKTIAVPVFSVLDFFNMRVKTQQMRARYETQTFVLLPSRIIL